ncbi:MAG: hypothetical protein AAB426_00215 [Myxococcota bacterium]
MTHRRSLSRCRHAASAVLLAVVMTGCTAVYVSSAANAPLLARRAEGHVRGVLGTNGGDLQAAYALSDDVALTAAASGALGGDRYRHAYGELGFGRYRAAGQRRMSLSGGGGYGGFRLCGAYPVGPIGAAFTLGDPFSTDVCAAGHLYRAFAQAAVARVGDVFEVGFVGRLTLDHMRNLRGTYRDDFWTSGPRLRSLPSAATVANLEPLGFVRLGVRAVKLELQVGLRLPLTSITDGAPVSLPFHVGLGVHVPFGGAAGGNSE